MLPINIVHVDSVEVHVVERTHFAQPRDVLPEQLQRHRDLGLGAEAADAEAQRVVVQLLADAERAQHLGRLERLAGAGGARGQSHVPQTHEQRLALHELEGLVERARLALAVVRAPVQHHQPHVLQAAFQHPRQPHYVLLVLLPLLQLDPRRFPEPHRLVRRQGPAPEPSFLPAPRDLCVQPHSLRLPTHIQSSDSFRALDFMGT